MSAVENKKLENYQYAQMFGSVASQYIGGQGATFINSILTVANPNADAQTATMGMFQLIGGVFSLGASKMAAKQDVSSSSERIESGERKVDNIKKTISDKIEKRINDINSEIENVQKELDKLDKNSKTVQDKQKELDEQKTKVDEAVKILNDPDSDKDKKKSALAELSSASAAIKALLESISSIGSEIEESQDKVKTSSESITEHQNESEAEIAQAFNEIETETGRIAQENSVNTGYIAQGGGEIAAGEAEQAKVAASTLAASVTGGSSALLGAAQEKRAMELIGAGNEHISGGTLNLAELGSALGVIGSNYSALTSIASSVGSALSSGNNIVGAFESELPSLVTTIGSWSNLTQGLQSLDSAVKNYQQNVNNNDENNNLVFKFDTKSLNIA